MANSLLDFVMSVVRDPEVAAHYAANPAQAIADANLTGVTTADVDHLIPVVAESFPSAVASTGVDTFGDVLGDVGGNVWASGAATAAFDAFDDHLPVRGLDDTHAVVTDPVIDTGDSAVPALVTDDDPALALGAPVLEDIPVVETVADWDHPDSALATPMVDDHDPQSDLSGFDLFD